MGAAKPTGDKVDSGKVGDSNNTKNDTGAEKPVSGPETLELYAFVSIPCILFSLQVIILCSFVIKCYWKERKKFVPMMYLMISTVDIICAIAVRINPTGQR